MENVGGQAVIEGVMMKSQQCWSVAVRSPDGSIELKKEYTKKLPKFLTLPVIRGVVALFQALYIGIKAIEFSGSVALDEKEKSKTNPFLFAVTIVLALGIAIVLFKFFPLYVATISSQYMPFVANSPLLFNLIDGIFRVFVFILYIVAIGLWSEMRRIYQYHGAEHKVIFAYEAGETLTVENAKKYTPYHPRCGTSFLMIVMVISILIFFMIPQEWSFAEKLLSRVLLIPIIAGLSYEVLKLSAKMKDHALIKIAILPGLLLQRLTVREPDDSQIEVAIKALNEVLVSRQENKEALLDVR
ncbi:MAG: DUF1385 domain-containing protein [Thermodesulfovibrionales bacterium]|nr:DUF1385 domain-containing protein [Thermodesulfovibrionales bacterium]